MTSLDVPSSLSVDSNRFSHFLAPIRDLSSNWSIDLAGELSEYLEELENVKISFDRGASQLNFAEAAILIQGSACVYSAKVEYLYNLLFSTLSALIDKRRKAGRAPAAIENGEDRDFLLFFDQETVLAPLDDNIPEGNSIDLQDENSAEERLLSRRKILQAQQPPAQDNEKSGNSGDFLISQYSISHSGALSLGAVDVSSVPAVLGSPAAAFRQARRSLGGLENSAAPAEFKENSLDDLDDYQFDDGINFGEIDQVDLGQQAEAAKGKKGVKFAEELCEIREIPALGEAEIPLQALLVKEAENPWIFLDPHDAGAVRSRPVKRGRPFTIPSSASAVDSFSLWFSLSEDSLIRDSRPRSSLFSPFYPEFDFSFSALASERREAARRKNKTRKIREKTLVLNKRQAVEEEAALSQAYDDFQPFDDDGDEGPLFVPEFPAEPRNPWENLPGKEENLQLPGPSSVEEFVSYEQLCRSHVEFYTSSALDYLASNALGSRVQQWTNKIQPILEAQEQEKTFDLKDYGEKLIEILAKTQENKEILAEMPFGEALAAVHEKAGEKSLENSHDFPVNSSHEVCRFFLASLQLANAGALEIITNMENLTFSIRKTEKTEEAENSQEQQKIPQEEQTKPKKRARR